MSKALRLKRHTDSLMTLKGDFHIHQFTEYHFRINNRLDIWPTNNRWHDIKTNQRGKVEGIGVAEFIENYFAKSQSNTAVIVQQRGCKVEKCGPGPWNWKAYGL